MHVDYNINKLHLKMDKYYQHKMYKTMSDYIYIYMYHIHVYMYTDA